MYRDLVMSAPHETVTEIETVKGSVTSNESTHLHIKKVIIAVLIRYRRHRPYSHSHSHNHSNRSSSSSSRGSPSEHCLRQSPQLPFPHRPDPRNFKRQRKKPIAQFILVARKARLKRIDGECQQPDSYHSVSFAPPPLPPRRGPLVLSLYFSFSFPVSRN